MKNEQVEALKRAILIDRSGRGRFSDDLRERLRVHVLQMRQAGQSVERSSRELGLCSKTVHGWLVRDKGAGLRKVEVIAERSLSTKRLTVHGPAGTRIDHLELDDVVALWRKLS